MRGFVIPIADVPTLHTKLKSDFCEAAQQLSWRDFRLPHANQSFYEDYNIENEGDNFCLSVILAACPEAGSKSTVDAAFYIEFKNRGPRMARQFSEEERGFLPLFLAFSLVWGGLTYVYYMSYRELQLMSVSSALVGVLNVVFISAAAEVLAWLVYFFIYSVEGMCPLILNITAALAELIQEAAIVGLLVCHSSGYFLQPQPLPTLQKSALGVALFFALALQVYRVYSPGDLITFELIPWWPVLLCYRSIIAVVIASVSSTSYSFNVKLVASPTLYTALTIVGFLWLTTLPSMCLLSSLFSRFSRKIVEAIIKLVCDSLLMSMLLFLTWPSRVSQVFVSSLPSLSGKFYYQYT
jgi:hypothetical protein